MKFLMSSSEVLFLYVLVIFCDQILYLNEKKNSNKKGGTFKKKRKTRRRSKKSYRRGRRLSVGITIRKKKT